MRLKAPLQRRLKLNLDTDAPLASLAQARFHLGEETDFVRQLIENGLLAWAWDIGMGREQAEVRILTKCLSGYQTTGHSCNLADRSEAEIIGWILAREKKPWVEGARLAFIFGCEREHINALVDALDLLVVPGTQRRPGPRGSDRVLVTSIWEFLKKRRIK